MALTDKQKERLQRHTDYWRDREDEALKHYIKDEAEYDKQINRIYQDMLDSCNEQINAFYGRYASKEGITLAEAKKRVGELEIKEYERKAKRYVKDKDFSDKANEEMRLYNATMRINRLEMLKANIGLETVAGFNELEKFMGGVLKGRTLEELERQAGILGKSVRNNAKLAHAIPNASFHHTTFSERIWQYQGAMRDDLSKILTRALIQGKNPRAVAKELQKYWYGNDPRTGAGATYCMERLMRTELARVQTEAQKQSYERNGFTHYKFLANSGCCDLCKGLNNEVFEVAKMKPGENASPIHPHCRCSTAAYSDREEYDAWLEYLSAGGTTEEWNKLKDDSVKQKVLTNTVKRNKIPLEPLSIYLNSSEKLYANAKKVKPEQEYEDVFIHSDKSGFAIRDKDGNEIEHYTPKEFAEILKADPNYKGGSIRLFACESAAEGATAAQSLSNQLGVEILAPSDVIWIDSNGEYIIGSESDAIRGINTGKWIKIIPQNKG